MTTSGNILIIDDQPERAQAMAELLELGDFTSQIITDVLHAQYPLGDNSDIDAVLCEVNLDGISWKDTTAALREMGIQIPAIMVSDKADLAEVMMALRLGASDFFARPINNHEALFRTCDEP